MASNKLVIFGSAEIASLARFYFEHDSDWQVIAYTVDDSYVDADSFDGLPLLAFSEVQKRFPPDQANMHVALSYNRLNRQIGRHTSELQSLMRISYAVFCLKQTK